MATSLEFVIMHTLLNSFKSLPLDPVSPIIFIPFILAVKHPKIIFLDLPEVEIASNVSWLCPKDQICCAKT